MGGKNIRTRSGALIDGTVKVDFGPDTCAQMQRERRDLGAITTLVFTHEHDDHFTPAELQYRKSMFVAGEQPARLQVFGNRHVMEALAARFDDPNSIAAAFEAPIQPFVETVATDGTRILPVPAVHIPDALLLRIHRGGRSLLYGHDSGPFSDESVAALGAAGPLDAAVFDCTYGATERPQGLHMGIEGVAATIDRLRDAGAVTDRTRLIATHISHQSGLLYDRFAERLAPRGIELAYDGMAIYV